MATSGIGLCAGSFKGVKTARGKVVGSYKLEWRRTGPQRERSTLLWKRKSHLSEQPRKLVRFVGSLNSVRGGGEQVGANSHPCSMAVRNFTRKGGREIILLTRRSPTGVIGTGTGWSGAVNDIQYGGEKNRTHSGKRSVGVPRLFGESDSSGKGTGLGKKNNCF